MIHFVPILILSAITLMEVTIASVIQDTKEIQKPYEDAVSTLIYNQIIVRFQRYYTLIVTFSDYFSLIFFGGLLIVFYSFDFIQLKIYLVYFHST